MSDDHPTARRWHTPGAWSLTSTKPSAGWKNKQEIDTGMREGVTSEEHDRINALERDVSTDDSSLLRLPPGQAAAGR